MTAHSPIRRLGQFLERPFMRPALQHRRRRYFLSKDGFASYFGIFESFTDARAWLPPSPEFDNPALAAEYVAIRAKRIFTYDYPVMWWLQRAFRNGATKVLDIGGSVGVHYYAYQHYLDMPSELSWRVAEVPEMVAIGREMAAQAGAGALSFTDDLEQVLSGADIWISAGAIQYIEDARPSELLKRCAVPPKHILLDRLPLYAGRDFITTQNVGEGSFSPLHVYNREDFIHDIAVSGYTLGDHWAVHERSLYLPGYSDRSFPTFTGLYFTTDVGKDLSPSPVLADS